MKQFIKLVFLIAGLFFCLGSLVYSQNRPLGTWKTYIPFQQAQCITEIGRRVFVGTELSMFAYDRDDSSIETFTRVGGFSEMNIVAVDHQDALGVTVVIYKSGIIDLYENGQITPITDIKRANILGAEIYDTYFLEERLYIATSFGVVVLDVEAQEIVDTYKVSMDGSAVAAYQVTILGEELWVATEQGLFRADSANPNLANFNNWTPVTDLPSGRATKVVVLNNRIYTVVEEGLYERQADDWMPIHGEEGWLVRSLTVSHGHLALAEMQGSLVVGEATSGKVSVLTPRSDGSFEEQEYTQGIFRPQAALVDASGIVWVADFWRGLLRFEGSGSPSLILPEGPYNNAVFSMSARNNQLWVASGGFKSDLDYQRSRAGFFLYENGEWRDFRGVNTPIIKDNDLQDFTQILPDVNGNKVYVSSYGGGVLEYDGSDFLLWDGTNSTLGSAVGDVEGQYRVSSMVLDRGRNLWVTNTLAAQPISVKTPEGNWYAYEPTISRSSLYGIIADFYDQKWMIVNGAGILVMRNGEDLASTRDADYLLMTTANGLPSNKVNCLALDWDGFIWVGTDDGVTVFYCPSSVFTDGCSASRFNIDGRSIYLLRDNNITAMAVDAANRKWIGTTTGVWLMSADGEETLAYFNKDNSPLLSNVITALTIDGQTGEVFIGTDQGVIAYQGDALLAEQAHSDVVAYPNPVRPDYTGDIAIKGLARNAFVKITDVSGNLVYETQANGGQAIWDGADYTGRRASTGVYLVFSVNQDGTDTYVTKLVVVRGE